MMLRTGLHACVDELACFYYYYFFLARLRVGARAEQAYSPGNVGAIHDGDKALTVAHAQHSLIHDAHDKLAVLVRVDNRGLLSFPMNLQNKIKR